MSSYQLVEGELSCRAFTGFIQRAAVSLLEHKVGSVMLIIRRCRMTREPEQASCEHALLWVASVWL